MQLPPLASEVPPTFQIKQGIVGNRDSNHTAQHTLLLIGALKKSLNLEAIFFQANTIQMQG